MATFYTYLHRRADTKEAFYIGKGAGNLDRANATNRRSKWWKAIVEKAGGRSVQILAYWPTEAEALEHEKLLIVCFRELGAPLCNMTEGGDGVSGCFPSAETRAKISAARKGVRLSAEHRAKLSSVHAARKRGPLSVETRKKIGVASSGRRHNADTRAKIGAASAGRNNGRRGVKFSDEHRAKLSAAAKARWRAKRM